jgi:hypothetical protein
VTSFCQLRRFTGPRSAIGHYVSKPGSSPQLARNTTGSPRHPLAVATVLASFTTTTDSADNIDSKSVGDERVLNYSTTQLPTTHWQRAAHSTTPPRHHSTTSFLPPLHLDFSFDNRKNNSPRRVIYPCVTGPTVAP